MSGATGRLFAEKNGHGWLLAVDKHRILKQCGDKKYELFVSRTLAEQQKMKGSETDN